MKVIINCFRTNRSDAYFAIFKLTQALLIYYQRVRTILGSSFVQTFLIMSSYSSAILKPYPVSVERFGHFQFFAVFQEQVVSKVHRKKVYCLIRRHHQLPFRDQNTFLLSDRLPNMCLFLSLIFYLIQVPLSIYLTNQSGMKFTS